MKWIGPDGSEERGREKKMQIEVSAPKDGPSSSEMPKQKARPKKKNGRLCLRGGEQKWDGESVDGF